MITHIFEEGARSATHGSAMAFGLSEETGTLQVGKWADCLVLEAGALTPCKR